MGATKRAEERVEVVRNEGAAVRRAREKFREADAIVQTVDGRSSRPSRIICATAGCLLIGYLWSGLPLKRSIDSSTKAGRSKRVKTQTRIERRHGKAFKDNVSLPRTQMATIFLETTASTHFDSLCANQTHYGA